MLVFYLDKEYDKKRNKVAIIVERLGYAGGMIMSVKYNKLWKLLIDRGMNKSDLGKAAKMSPNTIAKLGKNEKVSMDILIRICQVLECDVGDIMEVVFDGN